MPERAFIERLEFILNGQKKTRRRATPALRGRPATLFEYLGERKTAQEWANKLGLARRESFYWRLARFRQDPEKWPLIWVFAPEVHRDRNTPQRERQMDVDPIVSKRNVTPEDLSAIATPAKPRMTEEQFRAAVEIWHE